MDDETQMRLCQLNVTFSMDMLARAGGRGAMKLQLRSTVSAGSMHGRLGRRRLVLTGPTVGTGVSSIVPLSEMFCRIDSITRLPHALAAYQSASHPGRDSASVCSPCG